MSVEISSPPIFYGIIEFSYVSDDIRTRIETLIKKVKEEGKVPQFNNAASNQQRSYGSDFWKLQLHCKLTWKKRTSRDCDFLTRPFFAGCPGLIYSFYCSTMFHPSWMFEDQDEICLERCSLHLSREFIMWVSWCSWMKDLATKLSQ